jgi:flavodoxin short chain
MPALQAERSNMSKVQVVYWSQGGNTQAMAEAVGRGIVEAGKEAEVVFVSEASLDSLKESKAFALGCPAMGAEVLEESEMEPFVADVEAFASGKTIALFGSYGWGDGQWMRDWVDRMNSAGAQVMNGEGVICQETPDDAVLAECVALGKALAEKA